MDQRQWTIESRIECWKVIQLKQFRAMIWKNSNYSILLFDRFRVNPLTGQLSILRVSKDDFGNYTCKATNTGTELSHMHIGKTTLFHSINQKNMNFLFLQPVKMKQEPSSMYWFVPRSLNFGILHAQSMKKLNLFAEPLVVHHQKSHSGSFRIKKPNVKILKFH